MPSSPGSLWTEAAAAWRWWWTGRMKHGTDQHMLTPCCCCWDPQHSLNVMSYNPAGSSVAFKTICFDHKSYLYSDMAQSRLSSWYMWCLNFSDKLMSDYLDRMITCWPACFLTGIMWKCFYYWWILMFSEQIHHLSLWLNDRTHWNHRLEKDRFTIRSDSHWFTMIYSFVIHF